MGRRRSRSRGQVMLVTVLGIVMVLLSIVPLLTHLQLSSENTQSEFRSTVNNLSFNFKEASTISLSEVSQALELKCRSKGYENYTSLDEYPAAEDVGSEFLVDWKNETLIQYQGLGLSMNLSSPVYECEWASGSYRSRMNGTIHFDIPHYSFEGWEYQASAEANLQVLNLNHSGSEYTSFFFQLTRENSLPIEGLQASSVQVYFNSTDGKFQKADSADLIVYPVGDGKYLARFRSVEMINPPCVKMVIQDPRGVIVAALPEDGIVLTLGEDQTGPRTLNLNYDPQPVNLGESFTLTGIIDDTETGWSTIASSEYFVDSTGPNGTGAAMTASDGSYDAYTESVEAAVDTTGWSLGEHTIHVHGRDAEGNWGDHSQITVEVTDQQTLYVYSIEMDIETQWFLFWRGVRGVATVTIQDTGGGSVEDAQAQGTWSEATSDTDQGSTDQDGEVVLKSDWVWLLGGWGDLTFTFTVDDVVKSGWNYDPDMNLETSDSIDYP